MLDHKTKKFKTEKFFYQLNYYFQPQYETVKSITEKKMKARNSGAHS